MEKKQVFDMIAAFCKAREVEFNLIPTERKSQLEELSQYIAQKFEDNQIPKLVVICTHNSRRSHIGQIWLAVMADYFQLPKIETFSGGTEGTAFNIRAVNAFQRIGFDISTETPTAENPIYNIKWTDEMQPYQAFSKKYEAAPNPTEAFAAIMVCTQADEGCPIVSGCDYRLSLPYDDPKTFDETELEAAKYDERVRQIGREIMYTMSKIKTKK